MCFVFVILLFVIGQSRGHCWGGAPLPLYALSVIAVLIIFFIIIFNMSHSDKGYCGSYVVMYNHDTI